MQQELFRIPGLDVPIYGYGLMLVLGFLAATQLARYLARRFGLNGELFVNAAIIGLVSGVLGARLSHVIENWSAFTRADRSVWQNLGAMVNLTSGGLTFYGGFLVAFPVLVWYGIRKKVPVRLGMDIVAPCLMLGLAFGRVGCFLNGCCYGARVESPLSVHFPYHSPAYVDQVAGGAIRPPEGLIKERNGNGIRLVQMADARRNPELAPLAAREHAHEVLPAQIFSAFNALLLCAVLLVFLSVPHAAGRVFALMLILKGTTRFLLEMIRVEPRVLGPLSFSMAISVGLVLLGVVMWTAMGRMKPPATSPLPRPGT